MSVSFPLNNEADNVLLYPLTAVPSPKTTLKCPLSTMTFWVSAQIASVVAALLVRYRRKVTATVSTEELPLGLPVESVRNPWNDIFRGGA